MNEDAAEYLRITRQLKHDDEQKNREARRLVEFIRPEILEFAEALELKMRKKDKEYGDSHKNCSLIALYEKLEEEYKELQDEIYHQIFGKAHTTKSEAVDLGNCCMMIWNRKEVE